MQTIVRRIVAGVLLGIMVAAGPAGAASSSVSGWWTSAPVMVAPDVTADQLLVQGGPDASQPLAYAAVSFELTDGERPQRLALQVAAGSATTPASRLALCPLRSAALTAAGASAAEGPAFDCATKIEAAPSSDGTTYTFEVSSLSSGTSLDVAVLPTAQTDRVVLVRPGTDALQSQSSPGSGATEAGAPLPSSPSVFDPLPDAFVPVVGAGIAPEEAAGAASPSTVPTETAAPAAPVGSSFPVTGDGSGASLLAALLFAVLAAGAVGLWAVAGRQSPSAAAG